MTKIILTCLVLLQIFIQVKILPQGLTFAASEDVPYFLNAPDAPTELPAEYNEIKNLSEFETKKDELEAATVIVDEKDNTHLTFF